MDKLLTDEQMEMIIEASEKKRKKGRKDSKNWRIKNYKDFYIKNREKIIKNVMARIKKNNYASEKTPKQRLLRGIKRKTRYYFPLENNVCVKCGNNKILEHHHTTNPIVFDKFSILCHNCHNNIHNGGEII